MTWTLLVVAWTIAVTAAAGGCAVLAYFSRSRLRSIEAELARAREEIHAANRNMAEFGRKHTSSMAKMQDDLNGVTAGLDEVTAEQRRLLAALGSTVEVLF